MKHITLTTLFICLSILAFSQQSLTLNNDGYFEMQGLNITVFSDIYPDGHQTGVSIIQHGKRVVANGDVRLEVSPGQWSPIPKAGKKIIDSTAQTITQQLSYPDSSRHKKGFNPITYPDLILNYSVSVTPIHDSSFKVSVSLDKPLPEEWVGKVGFNMEIFPGDYFGKSYLMDDQTGIFTQQANGPVTIDQDHFVTKKMAAGKQLTIAPEDELQRILFKTTGELELWDGRGNHNNAWFIVRETIKANATQNAIEWIVTPNIDNKWKYQPVIHVSQVGYHPKQQKKAVIETDKNTNSLANIELMKLTSNGLQKVKDLATSEWGNFLRYNYFIADFSGITDEGMYQIKCGKQISNPFKIASDVYQKDVWQPVIDYYLPIQMCHMRVCDHYRIWHDACHMDDALMAPTNITHFDGYKQDSSTLCKYQTHEHVPGLNKGGWHDAGDFDLRVESQMGTVELLSLMLLEFNIDYDATLIDQKNNNVEIHKSDGQNDIVQQIEHGLLSVLNGYDALGRLYRGIIAPTIDEYVLMGDPASVTDNEQWDRTSPIEKNDDRWVFTEENQWHECNVGSGLATASAALKPHNKELSDKCLKTALELWESLGKNAKGLLKVNFAASLFTVTKDEQYAEIIYNSEDEIIEHIDRCAWRLARALPYLENEKFKKQLKEAIAQQATKTEAEAQSTPFGVPYKPQIWGHGWNNQRFGVEQYFIHKAWPDIVKPDYFMNALNFNLGVHPGENTASFASGIGSNSVLTGYGLNRADWGYIPGGVVSGTNLVRPDLPELKKWPYFWQQTEYVMGGGSTNFMFLVLAVDQYLNQQ